MMFRRIGRRLLCLVAALTPVLTPVDGAHGADWPTYQHDAARSGVTSERLSLPLSPDWVFESRCPPAAGWDDPEETEVWDYGVRRLGRVRYDDSFHVAAVGDCVYFASSGENKVYAVDASKGTVRWSFVTDAPPRTAPTVADGRVYFGADDGVVYCLDAETGRVVWKFQAAVTDENALGQGRMISLWPVRSGVLVQGDVAYFAAGLFPAEGLYLYALRADDGTPVWVNDSFDQGGKANVSPQGYLLASADKLFLPSGRVSPVVFDSRDGRLLYQVESGWGLVGGSYAMLTGKRLYNGTQQVMGYDLEEGRRIFSWFDGRRVLVHGDIAYLVTGSEMMGIAEEATAAASVEVDKLRKNYWDGRNQIRPYGRAQSELSGMEDDDPRRGRLMKDLQRSKPAYDAWVAEKRRVDEYLDGVCKWRLECEVPDAMILAGNVIFAGGEDRVIAVEASSGKKLWSAPVDGRARGLAVAAGRLYVGTTTGKIYSFVQQAGTIVHQAGPAAGEPRSVLPPTLDAPFPADRRSIVYARVADQIVRTSGIRKGYGLILGGSGRLALELALRTELNLYVIQPDADQAAAARASLGRAGLYGSRVTVRQGPLSSVPYPPYFANLIVSAEGFWGEAPTTPPTELLRMLRPAGGVAYVGQPPSAKESGEPIDPNALEDWLAGLGESNVKTALDGTWATITRGELPGAGDWSHQYADAGNTASSEDRLVKAPLGILWFGSPGPKKIIDRHARPPAPLSVAGRMFILGRNLVLAYDAYNGTPLWERPLPGSQRQGLPMECGSMAASGDGLFVLTDDQCHRLDAATGETRQTYAVPPREDGKRRRWGWIATDGPLLFGSRTESDRPYKSWPQPQYHTSESVFAVEISTGKSAWVHEGRKIMNASIALGGGSLFLIESGVTDGQRRQAIEGRITDPGEESSHREPPKDRKGRPLARDVRLVTALDTATGAKRWELPLDVTDCVVGPQSRPVAGGEISLIYKEGVLLLCSAPWNGHFLEEFKAGKFSRRSMIALAGDSGKLLWSGSKGYRSRPLVSGNTIFAEPWAHDLRTGQTRTNRHALSGRPQPWEIWRGYGGCGTMAGSASTLLFRSGTIGYCDLAADSGVIHFGGQRPGCWINCIGAGGLVLMPEGSSECVCPFPLQCSVALYPRKTNRAWGEFTLRQPIAPVVHLAVNLGAPGDRRDSRGTLWLAWPRKGMLGADLNDWMPYWGPMDRFYHHRTERLKITRTSSPWIYASGSRGLEELSFRLIDAGQPAGRYTVRLAFAEPENLGPGDRVFDVFLQAEQVLKDFDVAKTAGGPNRAIVKEFPGVEVTDVLKIRLSASRHAKVKLPVLCGMEAIVEQ